MFYLGFIFGMIAGVGVMKFFKHYKISQKDAQ